MNVRTGPDIWRERYVHPCGWDQQFSPLAMTDLFAQSVHRFGERPFLDFFGRTYSYRAVWAEARAFAAGLQRQGIAKGDRVGLFLPNVPTYLAGYFGAMMAGATVVNFSPLYTAEELEAQVADSRTRLLVTVGVPSLLPTAIEVLRESSLEQLVVSKLPAMLPFWKALALRVFGRGEFSPMPSAANITEWSRFIVNEEPRPVEIAPETDLALLQYTGGTTGTPKGAMLTHQNLSANARQIIQTDPFPDERDVILGVLPFFHVFANATVLNRTVLTGGSIAMLPRFRAGQTLKTLQRVRATSMPGVPTMYQALLDNPAIRRTDFSSLRNCISGGAPLPLPIKREFEAATGARLIEGYGLTETSGVVSTNPFAGGDRTGTIGHPLPGTDVRLLDKENPEIDPPPGEPGELAIHGPQIMRGYWNRPDSDKHAFAQRDGKRWLRTGDIATIDDDGFIRIVDRTKDMIAVGGFKVFPSQVEHVLVSHPDVKEALVIGVPDSYHGEMPRAFVSLQPDADARADDLREWLNEHVGKHERVDRVEIRESLPKTMVGKLDRKALRESLQTENASDEPA